MKKKVLLIDDSMTIHRVIDLSVDEDKYEVEKVFSVEDAEGKIKSFNPDIVLLDNKLEGIKLDEYVSRLKSETGASVILLVGAFDHFNESNLSATNADDFIVKPFNSSLLEEKLEKFGGQLAVTEVKDTDGELESSVEKDSAVEELLASIDSEESTEKETQFEDFDDLLAENTPSEDLVEDEKLNLELEESLEMTESIETKEESDESFGLEDIFDDEKLEEKTQEDLFDTALEEEKQSEDLTASESISDSILSDLLEEGIAEEEGEPKVISEEAPADQKEETELSDIFGELEDINDEEVQKDFSEEEALGSLEDFEEDEKSFEEDLDKSFTEVEEIEGDAGEDINAQDVADELTVDVPDEVELNAELEEKDMLAEEVEAPLSEEDVVAEDSVKHVEEEKLLVDKEMIKKVIEDSIDLDFLRDVVREVISKNLEKVIWEIVPDMAEKLIIEEIEKLKKGE